MKEPQSILVVGIERSGTKWLSNLLCNHSEVIGVQSERHRGILETNMFWQMPRKFDLSSSEDYVAMIELWSRSDFFQQTGINSSMFFELQPRAENCYALFRILMEEFARANNRRFWLQKVNPDSAVDLLEHFENAKSVVVTRNMLDVLRSTLRAKANAGKPSSVLHATYSFVVHEKKLRRILKRTGTLHVSYENLVGDLEGELSRLCRSLGIDYEPGMTVVPFAKNTSFPIAGQRRAVFSTYERAYIRGLYCFFRLVPLRLMSALSALKRASGRTEPEPFVRGSFSLLCEQRKLPSD